MNYKLLATDMDGTLLSSDHTISVKNQQAINRALDAGKVILFSTGRCLQELEEFFKLFPKMRYVISESGAGIYDLKEKAFLYQKQIPKEYVRKILDYTKDKDIMVQILADNRSILSQKDFDNLEYYFMGRFYDHFSRNSDRVESSSIYCKEKGWIADKICLYHPDQEQRQVTTDFFTDFPLSLAFSEKTSLEISPQGVDKGEALKMLCDHLGIRIEETVAVGDGFNDMTLLQTAGLSVAVENAVNEIKEVCDLYVADCNHDGVAEAIEKTMGI